MKKSHVFHGSLIGLFAVLALASCSTIKHVTHPGSRLSKNPEVAAIQMFAGNPEGKAFLAKAAAPLTYDGVANPSLNGSPGNYKTILVTKNTYAGLTAQGLKYVHLDFQGSDFPTTLTIGDLQNVDMVNGRIHDVSGPGFNVHGHNDSVNIDYWNFQSVEGHIIEASYNLPYTGTDASLVFRGLNVRHSYAQGCGPWIQGSWGGAATNMCFMRQIRFISDTTHNTTGNGTEGRGTFFELEVGPWYELYDTLGGKNPNLGDVGMFYNNGDFTGHDIVQLGDRGYINRTWLVGLNGKLVNSSVTNCRRGNTWVYGFSNFCMDAANGANYSTYTTPIGSWSITNNTMWNANDQIGYWNPFSITGTMLNGVKGVIRNNFGMNIVESPTYPPQQSNKGKFEVDQSNGTRILDSGGNIYLKSAVGAVDDQGKKLVNLPGVGAEVTGTPPIVVPPTPTTCNYDSAIRVYIASHPCPSCPAPVVCPVIDSAKIISNYLAAHPCPVCPPPIVCPVIPAARKVVSATFTGSSILFKYDDGTTSTLP